MGICTSPDGTKIAVTISEEVAGTSDLWIFERERKIFERITTNQNVRYPQWSPDGKYIAAQLRNESDRSFNLYLFSLDPGVPARQITKGATENIRPEGWTAKGTRLLVTKYGPDGPEVGLVDLKDGNYQTLIEPVGGRSDDAAVSPDGRWLAYSSWETGREEVYIKDLQEQFSRIRVSLEGGDEAQWSPDGKTLYFLNYGSGNLDRMMAVEVQTSPGLKVSNPKFLYQQNFIDPFEVDPLTGQFLITVPENFETEGVRSVANRIEIISDWRQLFESN